MPIEIFILSGARRGQRLTLDAPQFRAGADPGCEVRFDAELDPAAHGRAALFQLHGDGWYVQGTGDGEILLNHDPVRQLAQLRSGDIVRLSESGPDFSFTIVARTGAALPRTALPATPLPAAAPAFRPQGPGAGGGFSRRARPDGRAVPRDPAGGDACRVRAGSAVRAVLVGSPRGFASGNARDRPVHPLQRRGRSDLRRVVFSWRSLSSSRRHPQGGDRGTPPAVAVGRFDRGNFYFSNRKLHPCNPLVRDGNVGDRSVPSDRAKRRRAETKSRRSRTGPHWPNNSRAAC